MGSAMDRVRTAQAENEALKVSAKETTAAAQEVTGRLKWLEIHIQHEQAQHLQRFRREVIRSRGFLLKDGGGGLPPAAPSGPKCLLSRSGPRGGRWTYFAFPGCGSQKGVDMRISIARSARPVLVSRFMASTSNAHGRACGERVGRLHWVPTLNARSCPAQRSRL